MIAYKLKATEKFYHKRPTLSKTNVFCKHNQTCSMYLFFTQAQFYNPKLTQKGLYCAQSKLPTKQQIKLKQGKNNFFYGSCLQLHLQIKLLQTLYTHFFLSINYLFYVQHLTMNFTKL